MRRMESARKSSRLNASSASNKKREKFVLCVRNRGYAASLELRKLYLVLRDVSAAKHNLLRVVDESGEDYLYPADYFVALRLPAGAKLALSKAS
jgi:hypothetical protein